VTETYIKFKIPYGDRALPELQVFQWHKDFLEGQETVEYELCAGRPVTKTVSDDVDSAQDLMVDSETDSR
jgi:hypothetical protein